jgi:predicted RNA-binding protein with TRAM domain
MICPLTSEHPRRLRIDGTKQEAVFSVMCMEIADELLCLYSAELTRDGDSYVIEIPQREVTTGTLSVGKTYRVGLLLADQTTSSSQQTPTSDADPPVEPGDIVDVEIEDIGEQGDGIARVGPGYVVIVSNADLGERVAVEITEARDNVAFADVVQHSDTDL